MEKVPAVLRILCDLWRLALTTKGKKYKVSVSTFEAWIRENMKQPSLAAIKEAIGFFPSTGITQNGVKMANGWAYSQPCVAMRPVMLKDKERLDDGSLLKEYLEGGKE